MFFDGTNGAKGTTGVEKARIGVPVTTSKNLLSPVQQLDAYGNGIYYRTMSEKQSQIFRETGIMPATTETSISPVLTYSLSTDSLSKLITLLNHETYYVAHNLVSYKGKKVIFNGAVIKTSKDELIKFLTESVNIDDMREFLISPIFNRDPKQVLYLTEDMYYLYES